MEDSAPSLDLSRARLLLDRALVGLRAVTDPKVPLRSVERHLVASLEALYQLLASPGDPKVFQHHSQISHSRSQAALAALTSAQSKDPVVRSLARVVGVVVERWAQLSRRTPSEPLRLPRPGHRHVPRAQQGVPSLVELEREPLVPAIVLPVEEGVEELEAPAEAPPPEPRPVTLSELDALLAQAEAELEESEDPTKKKPALVPTGEKKPLPPALEEVERAQFGERLERKEVERARARSFFEDLSMMSLMRQPDEGDLWRELRPVETRLLARLDGILACGTWVLPELVELLDDRPVPDPELVWGALFVHGCLAGDDALHQIDRVLRTAGLGTPEVFDAACDALAFVPHPGLEALLREWLRTEDGLWQRMAVRVLGRRGALDAQQALSLTREASPELVIEAAQALPRVRGELDLRETARLLRHEQEEVVASAIEALVLRRSAAGIQHARALLAEGRGAFAGAALWVAIGGGSEVQADFEAALKGEVAPAVLEALGWYGSLHFVDFLLEQLRADRVEAVGALQRLTGASLTDDEPAPEYAKGEEPFVRGFEPPPVELELSKDVEVWSAWWKQHQNRAPRAKRHRWGHAWSTQDNLWEMEFSLSSMRERRLAYHELVARTGGVHPFDPRDFVARQEAALARWRQAPELRRVSVGSWPLSFMR